MSEPKVVNLNKARKAKARDAKRTRADENAMKFGRSKVEKQLEEVQKGQAVRHLDGHKQEP